MLGRDLAPGSLVDSRYAVIDPIGRGGMAVVYRVRHVQLGSLHALKLLQGSSIEHTDRLRREGRVQSQLRHPNVLPVTDVVDLAGAVGLVMPWVPGPSLRALLDRGGLDEPQARALAQGILSGVRAAHDAGHVHRDLKPANVLLDPVDGQLIPRVADFGLVKEHSGRSGGTGIGVAMGTPAYMAPEQAVDAGRADQSADLWSLGAILFELFTGRRAFSGQSPGGILQRVLGGQHAPIPSTLPQDVAFLVRACLQVDPTERPAGVSELLERLDAPATAPVWPGQLFVVDRPEAGGAQDPARTLTMSNLETPMPSGPVGVLPAEPDDFIGRRADLDALRQRLGTSRLVSVLGLGGTGKTRLVTHLGWQLQQDWPGGAWFVDLVTSHTVDEACGVLARTLDVPLGRADPVERLGHAIAGRGRCLLILDNFEQLATQASQTVGRWLQLAPEARFLVTSRERLNLSGEATLDLGPLPTEEAVTLFESRARNARGDFALDDADRARVTQLVELLDRLPLAIELAAARVRVMPPEKLLARMDQRFKLLRRSGGTPGRRATMRATLDTSWELLSDEEQAGLAQLSVFVGGFTLEAADAVLDVGDAWPEDVLQGLVDKSLVRMPSEGRFDLFMTVRDYALERLREQGDESGAEQRHGTFYASLLSDEVRERLDRGTYPEGWTTFGPELPNARAAAGRAIQKGDGETALRCLESYSTLIKRRGPLRPVLALLRRLVEIPLAPAQLCDASSLLGSFLYLLERYDDAALHLQRAVEAAQAEPQRALAVTRLGYVELARGRIEEARSLLQDARARYDALGDVHSCAVVDVNLIQLNAGEDATTTLAQLVATFEALDSPFRAAQNRVNLGGRYQQEGRLDEAARLYESGIETLRDMGDRISVCVVRLNLAQLHLLMGRHEEANRELRATLRAARQLGLRRTVGRCLTTLAVLHMHVGDHREAQAAANEALRLIEGTADPALEGNAVESLAEAALHQGDLDEASRRLERAHGIYQELGHRFGLVRLAVLAGRLSEALGDLDGARSRFAEAASVGRELGVAHAVALGAISHGRLLPEEDDPRPLADEAVAALDKVLQPAVRAEVFAARAAIARRLGEPPEPWLERARAEAPETNVLAQATIRRFAEAV